MRLGEVILRAVIRYVPLYRKHKREIPVKIVSQRQKWQPTKDIYYVYVMYVSYVSNAIANIQKNIFHNLLKNFIYMYNFRVTEG